MYIDKYEDTYEFLTPQEQLEYPETVDWSDKFIEKKSEKYTYGSYARQNWFRYKYNEKDDHHHDGSIDINNENLKEGKDAIKSKIYSPESDRTLFLGENRNVYKMWKKEIL